MTSPEREAHLAVVALICGVLATATTPLAPEQLSATRTS